MSLLLSLLNYFYQTNNGYIDEVFYAVCIIQVYLPTSIFNNCINLLTLCMGLKHG